MEKTDTTFRSPCRQTCSCRDELSGVVLIPPGLQTDADPARVSSFKFNRCSRGGSSLEKVGVVGRAQRGQLVFLAREARAAGRAAERSPQQGPGAAPRRGFRGGGAPGNFLAELDT